MSTALKIANFCSKSSTYPTWVRLLVLSFLASGEAVPIKRSLRQDPIQGLDFEAVKNRLEQIQEWGLVQAVECNLESQTIAFDLP